VRSLITEPAQDGTAEQGDLVIRGLAWSGAAPIARVEVRIGDDPWRPATLAGERHRHSWQRWELPARLTRPGTVTIQARATDQAGRTQPDRPEWNPLGYATNAIHTVALAVAPASSGKRGPGDAHGHIMTERTTTPH
jgi:molybdenum-dependent oxidoreductase-like protein